jgi:HPt (histidine-containing phosphotransfer) domain-containing protein
MASPVDLERMREFCDGTEQGLWELADMFVAHLSEAVTTLQAAVGDAQADAIRAEAHKAAGSAGACGAHGLRALLARLEQLGAEHRLEGTPEVLQEIETELARLRAFLHAARETDPA